MIYKTQGTCATQIDVDVQDGIINEKDMGTTGPCRVQADCEADRADYPAESAERCCPVSRCGDAEFCGAGTYFSRFSGNTVCYGTVHGALWAGNGRDYAQRSVFRQR